MGFLVRIRQIIALPLDLPPRLRGGRAPFVAKATFPPSRRGNLPQGGKAKQPKQFFVRLSVCFHDQDFPFPIAENREPREDI